MYIVNMFPADVNMFWLIESPQKCAYTFLSKFCSGM